MKESITRLELRVGILFKVGSWAGLWWAGEVYILLKDLQKLKIFYRFITVQSQYKYLS